MVPPTYRNKLTVVMPRAVLLLLFFASGASGLVYEVVWMRLLSLTLSVTVYAVTTVLCAFMAGLALGAVIGGRLADRARRPLLVYGAIEMVIGVTGVATPWLLFGLAPAYVWLYGALDQTGVVFALGRFALAFGVLLVPCTLMGTTLPLLARAAVVRVELVGRQAGALYAVNTLGAVVGTMLAGFALVPAWGLQATSAGAAAVNLAVGLAALAIGARTSPLALAPRAAKAPADRIVWAACALFAVSGFTAMGYEVLWTRALEAYTHNSTYAYSAMLACFLFGIGAGSAVAAAVADRVRRPLAALGLVQLGIGITVLAALLVYARFDRLVPRLAEVVGGLASWSRVMALVFTEAGVTLLVTTLLFGATFPLVARVVVGKVDNVGSRIAAAYTANTAGTILGALATGFLLLPALGLQGSFQVLMLANLAVGTACLVWDGVWGRTASAPERPARRVYALAIAATAAAAVLALLPSDLFRSSFARRFGTLLFYREEVTDTVMVTEDQSGERMIRYADGRGTAGTTSVRDDRMYSHIALLQHPLPRTVLSICFGVGNSLGAILTYPTVERVDAVELSPGVIDAAPFFERTNRRPLADPRVRLSIQDGRNFLLASRNTYDVIRLDPPELHTAGVVNLYTREFYALARDHLAPGGVFSIWVNIVMTPEEDMRLVVRTLADVFPYVTIWHGPLHYSWVLNGSLEPNPPDLALLMKNVRQPTVAADLASIGVPNAFAFLNHFVMGGEAVARFAGGGPLATDDHTRLDFSVPRSLDSFFGISNGNTGHWLVQAMDPTAKHDVAVGIFFRKIARMTTFKQPVLPYLVNVDVTGLDAAAVRAKLDEAAARPSTGAVQGPPTPGGKRPAQTS